VIQNAKAVLAYEKHTMEHDSAGTFFTALARALRSL
jgi:hypothetical protein